MDNHHLRASLLKLQDRLSENDRQRLHFFLGDNISQRFQDNSSLCLILTLFDQDKINEQDMTLLINPFDEIQCTDFAQLLKQRMKRIPSNELNKSTENFISLTTFQDKENGSSQQDDQRKFALRLKRKQLFKILPMTQRWLFLFVLLSIILIGVVIGDYFSISQLRMKYDHILNEQAKNNEIIQYLKAIKTTNEENNQHLNVILLKYNETIEESTRKKPIEEDQKFTKGSTCGCQQWCQKHGSPYGVCGDGHTCLCTQNPITKEEMGDGCTCDEWCRKHGHKNGGICGDGYTCICSK